MNKLGESTKRYTNKGAKFSFVALILIIILFIGLFIFLELDSMGKVMLLITVPVFIALDVYMFFKSKTEVDLREHGMYIRTLNKQYEVLYSEITKFDKTKRIGKMGNTVIIFYLMIIEKNDGERITLPFKIDEEFLETLVKLGQFNS